MRLTGVEPSSETLALENDKLPAKNEPPLWNTLAGLCASAAHLCTEESVVATHIPSPCSANCNIGFSFEHSNTLSLVAKSVKYNYTYKQKGVRLNINKSSILGGGSYIIKCLATLTERSLPPL